MEVPFWCLIIEETQNMSSKKMFLASKNHILNAMYEHQVSTD